jgi:hypothetical protein
MSKIVFNIILSFICMSPKYRFPERFQTKILYEFLTSNVGNAPVTVAERSKACTALARSEAGIVGSNPIQGMNV